MGYTLRIVNFKIYFNQENREVVESQCRLRPKSTCHINSIRQAMWYSFSYCIFITFCQTKEAKKKQKKFVLFYFDRFNLFINIWINFTFYKFLIFRFYLSFLFLGFISIFISLRILQNFLYWIRRLLCSRSLLAAFTVLLPD